jgi:glycosyltransferase involved in cell wall biosynthesis
MNGIPVYIYGTPGVLGGATTKITHLLGLLRGHVPLQVVAPGVPQLHDRDARRILRDLEIPFGLLKDLSPGTGGTVLAVCEREFFSSGTARRFRDLGLRIVWSNEMMFPFPGEAEAAREGLIDRVLYVSEHQADTLRETHAGVSSRLTGNYIDPADFPFVERRNPAFTLGRLSRADIEKYPLDFPVFYEELDLPEARFRVMAWNGELDKQDRWHRFGPQWELLPANRELAARFLGSLDVFLYPLGHRVKESWGRAVVEAMLTGAVPVVPVGHHFEKLITHGESGFVCREYREYRDVVRRLHEDAPWRRQMSRQAADHARDRICNAEEHRRVWLEALDF